MIRPGEVIIHGGNARHFIDPVVGGERKSRGLVPRNYATHPVGCYASARPFHAVQMPTIPQSEWTERIRDKVAIKAQMSDVRLAGNAGQPIPSLDQGQVGYCWAHSSTHAVMLLRAVMGLPYVPLSAYGIAATIKHGADEGGWGAQSLDFITARGVPSQAIWPQGDRDYRKYDNAQTWDNAALHKVTEGWVDLQAAQYDRTLSWEQVVTCFLLDVPVVCDYNFWGHSVCGMDVVDGAQSYEAGLLRDEDSGKLLTYDQFRVMWDLDDPLGGYGTRILNSWSDQWGDRGAGVLAGSKARPDGATAPRVTTPSLI